MSIPVPVVVGGAAVAAVAISAKAAPVYPKPTGYVTPSPGSSIVGATKPPPVYIKAGRVNQFTIGALGPTAGSPVALDPSIKVTNQPSPSNFDPALQAKLDAVEALAKAQYDNMDAVAKAKAADFLNKNLKLNPPLTGQESWDGIKSKVAETVGTAVGTAIGGPIGAIAGAYLGKELSDALMDIDFTAAYRKSGTDFKSFNDALAKINKLGGVIPGSDEDTLNLIMGSGGPKVAYNTAGNATISEEKWNALRAALFTDQQRAGFNGLNTADMFQLNAVIGYTAF